MTPPKTDPQKELDDYLWPWGKPLPVEIVLSRGLGEKYFQMPYNTLKTAIEAYVRQREDRAFRAGYHRAMGALGNPDLTPKPESQK